MPFGTIINKGGFETGLDAGYFAFVDVGLTLLAVGGFDVQVIQFLPIDDRHAQLFGLGGIDKNTFHVLGSR